MNWITSGGREPSRFSKARKPVWAEGSGFRASVNACVLGYLPR